MMLRDLIPFQSSHSRLVSGTEPGCEPLFQVLDVKTKEYEVARHSLFFNDTDARKIYKDYVKAIVTRVNSVNGRKYSEDPTLMSWGLLNEPRCETWLVTCPPSLGTALLICCTTGQGLAILGSASHATMTSQN